MANIKIHNVPSTVEAAPLIAALQGQSFMNLDVQLCPIGGSFDVHVETLDPNVEEAELTEMVLGILAHEICRAGRVDTKEA